MRRALVTGGTRGIGLAIAKALVRAGHEVTVTWSKDEASAQAAGAQGLHTAQFDVAVAVEVDKFFASLQESFDIVVHCAGFTRDKLMMMMPEADFDAVLGVHLKGAYLVDRKAIRGMIGNKWGRIVHIVSPSGIIGRPGQTNYSAAKAGLMGLS